MLIWNGECHCVDRDDYDDWSLMGTGIRVGSCEGDRQGKEKQNEKSEKRKEEKEDSR